MAQPSPYNRDTDFTTRDGDDTDHAALNAELDGAAQSINEIRDNLALIQRDDGGLKNGIVGADQLAPSAFDAFQGELNQAVQAAQTAVEESTRSALAAGESERAAEDSAEAAGQSASNAAASAANAAGAATAALSAIYYGPLASNPTTDPNGQPINEGDFYFNTTTMEWRAYSAAINEWVPAQRSGSFRRRLFNAGVDFTAGASTSLPFDVSLDAVKTANVFVSFSGVNQHAGQFSIDGAAINFVEPIPAGVQQVEVAYMEALITAVSIDGLDGSLSPSPGFPLVPKVSTGYPAGDVLLNAQATALGARTELLREQAALSPLEYERYADILGASQQLAVGQIVDSIHDQMRYTINNNGEPGDERPLVKVNDYAKIDAYDGRGTRMRVQDATGMHWWVRRGELPENIGTRRKDSLYRTWERETIGAEVLASWFNVTPSSADVSTGMNAAVNFASEIGKPLCVDIAGWYVHSKPIVLPTGFHLKSSGEMKSFFIKNTHDTSGLPSLRAPESAGAQGIYDNYDVDANFIIYPGEDGAFARSVRIDGIYSEGRIATEKTTYGLYAPRLCLSNIKNSVFSGDTGIYTRDCWMTSWERVRASRCGQAGWVFDGAYIQSIANNAAGTSNSFVACWANDVEGVGWLFRGMAYSHLSACGADNIRGANGLPGKAYVFVNSLAMKLSGCGCEDITGSYIVADNSTVSFDASSCHWMNIHSDLLALVNNPFPVIEAVNGASLVLDNMTLKYQGNGDKVMPYFIAGNSRIYLRAGTRLPNAGLFYGDRGVANDGSDLIIESQNTIRAFVKFTITDGVISIIAKQGVTAVVINGVGDITVQADVSQTLFKELTPVVMTDRAGVRHFGYGFGTHRFTVHNDAGVKETPSAVTWMCM